MIRTTARHLGVVVLPALLLAGVSSVAAQEGPTKIAVVDIERIVTGSTAGQELQRNLDTFRQAAEQELQAKADAVAALKAQITATSDLAERGRLTKEYEQGAIELNRLQDDKQREGQKIQQDGLADIEKALGPIFKKIREEEGWDLILARTPGITLVVSDRVDITQQILDRYNAVQ